MPPAEALPMNGRLALAKALCVLLLAWAMPASGGAADDEIAQLIAQYGLRETPAPLSARPGWRRPTRVLVDAGAAGLLDGLRPVAPDVELVPVATSAELRAAAPGADAVIGRQAFVCDPDLLAVGGRLRWLQATSSGVERCAGRPELADGDPLLTNMRAIAGPVIAEHTIAMMLALTRGLHVSIPRQAQGDWRTDYPGTQLVAVQGRTMLVVGLGGIGGGIAQRASALGMRVTATRATRQEKPPYVDEVGLPEDLPRLIAAADVVVHAAPLTPATVGLYDARMFARMKPTAYFINVARGGAVVEPDLLVALETRRIAGAALDVTAREPLPRDHPLWRAPNLVLTPHMSSDTDAGTSAALRVIRENLRRFLAGGWLLSPVDPGRGY
jgi:phosphoglycerate dehydrogenase-like enzyme